MGGTQTLKPYPSSASRLHPVPFPSIPIRLAGNRGRHGKHSANRLTVS
jgi:hypothetical protein